MALPVVFVENSELEENHGIEQGELIKDCLINRASVVALVPEENRTFLTTCEGSDWLIDLYIADILVLMEIAEIGE